MASTDQLDVGQVRELLKCWEVRYAEVQDSGEWIVVVLPDEREAFHPGVKAALRGFVERRQGSSSCSSATAPVRGPEVMEGEVLHCEDLWHGSQPHKLRSFLKEGGVPGGASPKGIYGFRKREVAMKAGYGDKGLVICFSVNGLLLSSKDTSGEWDWENEEDGPPPGSVWTLRRSPWKNATEGKRLAGTTKADYQELVASKECTKISEIWISKQRSVAELSGEPVEQRPCMPIVTLTVSRETEDKLEALLNIGQSVESPGRPKVRLTTNPETAAIERMQHWLRSEEDPGVSAELAARRQASPGTFLPPLRRRKTVAAEVTAAEPGRRSSKLSPLNFKTKALNQSDYSAPTAKPTRIVVNSALDHIGVDCWPVLDEFVSYVGPLPRVRNASNVSLMRKGPYEEGPFRTSASAAYPPALCEAFAAASWKWWSAAEPGRQSSKLSPGRNDEKHVQGCLGSSRPLSPKRKGEVSKKKRHGGCVPKALIGQESCTVEGERICFAYNLGSCQHAGDCAMGKHLCCRKFCSKPHPFIGGACAPALEDESGNQICKAFNLQGCVPGDECPLGRHVCSIRDCLKLGHSLSEHR